MGKPSRRSRSVSCTMTTIKKMRNLTQSSSSFIVAKVGGVFALSQFRDTVG